MGPPPGQSGRGRALSRGKLAARPSPAWLAAAGPGPFGSRSLGRRRRLLSASQSKAKARAKMIVHAAPRAHPTCSSLYGVFVVNRIYFASRVSLFDLERARFLDPHARVEPARAGGQGWCSRCPGAFLSFGLKVRMPSRARTPFIRLTILVCSTTSVSRSRCGRLASSCARLGMAAILQ